MNTAQRRAHALLWPILGPAILLALLAVLILHPRLAATTRQPMPAEQQR